MGFRPSSAFGTSHPHTSYEAAYETPYKTPYKAPYETTHQACDSARQTEPDYARDSVREKLQTGPCGKLG